MGLDVNLCRRWVGVVVLVAALAMLIAGETVLKTKLTEISFLVYWLICFCFTGLAVLIALLDARALRERARQQRRELLNTTLKEIQDEARSRSRKGNTGAGRKRKRG